MFAELGLDVVYICLPPYAHGREVELACEHGVHFLIEKPIALSMELAESMAASVQASGVQESGRLLVSFRRGCPATQATTAYRTPGGLHGGTLRL